MVPGAGDASQRRKAADRDQCRHYCANVQQLISGARGPTQECPGHCQQEGRIVDAFVPCRDIGNQPRQPLGSCQCCRYADDTAQGHPDGQRSQYTGGSLLLGKVGIALLLAS
ncbi:hypothetical protein G6F66_015168 [Rhizopus arrhizus]|nr:hypothetical protein G6F66_015168 [Rhizopus arrhizus]